MQTAEMKTEVKVLEGEIAALQAIQKTHSPKSSAWMVASELLAPKFERMAMIQKAGHV